MRRRSFLAGALIGLFALAIFVAGVVIGDRTARAQLVQDTGAAPQISLSPQQLLRFWSNQAAARGVTTDAQWSSAMSTLFQASNWPGVDPTALAFLRSFFTQYVHVGP